MSVKAILSTGQGHGQVTKGHYIQKSHCGHVIHVLWPILAIEFDGYVSLVVWDRFQKFLAKVRSKKVKKGQIFKFIDVYKKGINLDQFRLRNLMVSFVFAYDPQKLQKSHLKNYVIIGYAFGDKNTSFGGQKLSYWLEILYTGRLLVDE